MTMRSNTKKRLALVQQVIGSAPIPADQQRAAFETFKATGELPADDRLAMSVLDRVRRGYDLPDGPIVGCDWGPAIQAMMTTPKRAKDEFMDSLLNEAVNGPALIRVAARALLVQFAALGLDVTGTPFHGTEVPMPNFGSIGMHYLRVLEELALPPYVRQAKRLFRRVDDLRDRLQHRPNWHDPIRESIDRFQLTGELPSEQILADAVLVLMEINTLVRHACGEDVRELMARFEEIARAKGKARRDEAIGKLQEMAEAGGAQDVSHPRVATSWPTRRQRPWQRQHEKGPRGTLKRDPLGSTA